LKIGHSAECHYAECSYAECRGSANFTQLTKLIAKR
jgi:hypothetical protein